MKLYELIERSAKEALPSQQKDGSMLPGHNGPYYDKETPVRNTGHWLITLLRSYEISKNERYRNAAEKMGAYLLSHKARPHGYTFIHRNKERKDSCNGLIGQAWSIEALMSAYTHLHNDSFKQAAIQTFLLHNFDTTKGLWHIKEIDGTDLSIDGTLNHQIWFAMAGSLLPDNDVQKQIQVFLDKLPGNMEIQVNGLIQHSIKTKKSLKFIIHKLLKYKKGVGGGTQKAIGYHQFNLYALALLQQQYPKHSFWKSELFQKALLYAQSPDYKNELEENKYGYPYNIAGIEMAFVLQECIPNTETEQQKWIEKQLDLTRGKGSLLLSKDTEDPKTLSARIYEATRLRNLELSTST